MYVKFFLRLRTKISWTGKDAYEIKDDQYVVQ